MADRRGTPYGTDFEAKRVIIELGQRMHTNGWMPAGDGCLSVRVGSDVMWITKAGCDKAAIAQGDLLRVCFRELDGRALRPQDWPEEAPLHVRLYQALPWVRCVAHAYPPQAGVAATEPAWQGNLLPCTPATRALRQIQALPCQTGVALAAQALRTLPPDGGRAMLIQNDGCYAWGETPLAACQTMEAIEYSMDYAKRQGASNPSGLPMTPETDCRDAGGVAGREPTGAPQRYPTDAASAGSATPAWPNRPADAGQPMQPPRVMGKIPELVIRPNRYSDREAAKAIQVLAKQSNAQAETGGISGGTASAARLTDAPKAGATEDIVTQPNAARFLQNAKGKEQVAQRVIAGVLRSLAQPDAMPAEAPPNAPCKQTATAMPDAALRTGLAPEQGTAQHPEDRKQQVVAEVIRRMRAKW